MQVSKPHPFVAGIADFYVAFYLLGSMAALASVLTGAVMPPLWAFLAIPVVVIVLIGYYRSWSKKVSWLSAGESIAGRLFNGEGKAWVNPYTTNRFFLFFTILLTLLIFGNSWDGLGRGHVYAFSEWFWTTFGLGMLTIGYMGAGRGRNWWILPVWVPMIISGVAALQSGSGTSMEAALIDAAARSRLAIIAAVIFGGLFVLNTVCYAVYRTTPRDPRPKVD